MNSTTRAAIDAAQAAYDTAARSGDFTARRHALVALMRTKAASMPRTDHNGYILPDEDPDPAGPAAAAA